VPVVCTVVQMNGATSHSLLGVPFTYCVLTEASLLYMTCHHLGEEF
jgi:hypothetical protein